jgi:hypothetical protein
MRNTISLALTLLMVMHLVPVAVGEDSVASQINSMPTGAKVELLLKNKQTMRGTRGPVSNSGFTLIDARQAEHQIAFDDVASVKWIGAKSHTVRNILIVTGIGVAALGITAGILLRCGPFGRGKKTL